MEKGLTGDAVRALRGMLERVSYATRASPDTTRDQRRLAGSSSSTSTVLTFSTPNPFPRGGGGLVPTIEGWVFSNREIPSTLDNQRQPRIPELILRCWKSIYPFTHSQFRQILFAPRIYPPRHLNNSCTRCDFRRGGGEKW